MGVELEMKKKKKKIRSEGETKTREKRRSCPSGASDSQSSLGSLHPPLPFL